MEIPSFQDFWNSLSEDQIAKWVSSSNEAQLKMKLLPLSEDSLNANLTSIATVNLLISRNMLAAYHEWLSRQLSDQS